jgi:hypothetical protein
MTLGAQKSTFPIALGVRLTGVDDKAFSQTGESYSMITMPNADSHTGRVLQEDNTELVRMGCPMPVHPHTPSLPLPHARSESRAAWLRRRTSVIWKRLEPQRKHLKPHHANHASPRALCFVGSCAQVRKCRPVKHPRTRPCTHAT